LSGRVYYDRPLFRPVKNRITGHASEIPLPYRDLLPRREGSDESRPMNLMLPFAIPIPNN